MRNILTSLKPGRHNTSGAEGATAVAEPEVPADYDSLTRGDVRIDWSDLGEGYNGDFDPSDPCDCAVLRFDVYGRLNATDADPEEWVMLDDASYSTMTPVSTPGPVRAALLELLMERLYENAQKETDRLNGVPEPEQKYHFHPCGSLRGCCQDMSFVQPEWLWQKKRASRAAS